jgi:urocanate hydratase
LLIDGSAESERKLLSMLDWDVNNGITRRAWARNEGAIFAIKRAMDLNPKLEVTLPNLTTDNIIDSVYGGED